MQKNKLVISIITAFVSVDEDGNEGIMGIKMPDGNWMPFVCADPERIAQVNEMAKYVSKRSGMPYRVIQFSKRSDITENIKTP